MPRPRRDSPKEAVADGSASFLDGTIQGDTPDAVAARRAQALARNLRAAIDSQGWGVREAADRTGVNYTRIYAVLRGDTFIDTRSLALLEDALGPLWEQ